MLMANHLLKSSGLLRPGSRDSGCIFVMQLSGGACPVNATVEQLCIDKADRRISSVRILDLLFYLSSVLLVKDYIRLLRLPSSGLNVLGDCDEGVSLFCYS